MKRNIYLASSWRNTLQPAILGHLRAAGHTVYDFRHPRPDEYGFQWSEIDPAWQSWTAEGFRSALGSDPARLGYARDFTAMIEADTCVLLLPCGRSAHLEAGYFVGAKKDLFICLTGETEPELMYKMATGICVNIDELLEALGKEDPRGV